LPQHRISFTHPRNHTQSEGMQAYYLVFFKKSPFFRKKAALPGKK